jgi:hypothetical protein
MWVSIAKLDVGKEGTLSEMCDTEDGAAITKPVLPHGCITGDEHQLATSLVVDYGMKQQKEIERSWELGTKNIDAKVQ